MARGHARHRGGNRWQLEVDVGSYINPKTGKRERDRRYRTITARGKREANRELNKFVEEVKKSNPTKSGKINFVDFVYNDWLPVAKERLSHTTLSGHLSQLRVRIVPAFKYLRMDQVTPRHIVQYLQNISEDGMRADGKKGKLSRSSIINNHRTLTNIFNYAEEIRVIEESPVRAVKSPKPQYERPEIYTLEESKKLIKALESETHVPHWQVIVKLAITAGMRRSELYGLEFKHIDLEKRTILIEQALTYSTEQGYQISPIKKGGRIVHRVVTLSKALVEPIRKLELIRKQERLAASELWRDGKYNFLLCNANGKPYNPHSLKNWWERFIKRHNLKYVNIHALRHTSATLLINEGVHAKIISERLGHADIDTTMDIYGHALLEADQKSTEILDSALGLEHIK